MRGDVTSEQVAAFLVVEIDDPDAILAQPVKTAGKVAALTHDERADAELAHQTAAIPAGRERSDHHHVAIAALAAGAAEGVGFGVHAGVSMLHSAVVAAAHQLSGFAEKRRANGDASFDESEAGLFESDGEHLVVGSHKNNVAQQSEVGGVARASGARARIPSAARSQLRERRQRRLLL
jgi:hypothetical protein